jgi:hypothetical protein
MAELSEDLRPALQFAYWTGWRVQNEVLSLTWAQADFDAGTVRLEENTTKSGSPGRWTVGTATSCKTPIEVTMPSFYRSCIAGAVCLCAVLNVGPATAQTRRGPSELLAAYVHERETPDAEANASRELVHALTNYGDYPAADLESLMRGLEKLAVTGNSPRLRADAAFRLSIPGSKRAVHPIPGVFARLERVYRRSKDPLTRSVLITVMAESTERQNAAKFLERIAKQEPADFSEAQYKAIQSLRRLDEEGRAALKRLHEAAVIQEPKAKLTLAILAKDGFPKK